MKTTTELSRSIPIKELTGTDLIMLSWSAVMEV